LDHGRHPKLSEGKRSSGEPRRPREPPMPGYPDGGTSRSITGSLNPVIGQKWSRWTGQQFSTRQFWPSNWQRAAEALRTDWRIGSPRTGRGSTSTGAARMDVYGTIASSLLPLPTPVARDGWGTPATHPSREELILNATGRCAKSLLCRRGGDERAPATQAGVGSRLGRSESTT
jgi:hypothetical protein